MVVSAGQLKASNSLKDAPLLHGYQKQGDILLRSFIVIQSGAQTFRKAKSNAEDFLGAL